MITITEATTPSQLNAVRHLIQDFVAWQRQTYHDHLDLLDKYSDPAAFQAELSGLPGKYARPAGCVLLATDGDQPVGCVMLRPIHHVDQTHQTVRIEQRVGEMKRMFVRPDHHGQGVGRALAERLIREAREIGYTRMWLDTGPRQLAAQGLYRSLGFTEIAAYYPLPADMAGFLLFMELVL